MKDTIIIEIDPEEIDNKLINKCASILREGGLVAFPTETVYGLGANALDPKAVRNIFIAKGRPADNPLIVHVSRLEDFLPLVKEVPGQAYRVMEEFWPGPLTIILEKTDLVPCEISGGLATVGIRMPNHPIALRLIREAGVPLAAPSANISGRPSPTRVDHVIEDLKGRVDAIIAGGDCRLGIESTVLDMTGPLPTILRPGGVTREDLERVLGEVHLDPALDPTGDDFGRPGEKPRSPGMKYAHYSPGAEMIIVNGDLAQVVNKIQELRAGFEGEGKRVGIICTDESLKMYEDGEEARPASGPGSGRPIIKSLGSRQDPTAIARNLFRLLREFDKSQVDIILCESIDHGQVGQAIMNRLAKAAGYNFINI